MVRKANTLDNVNELNLSKTAVRVVKRRDLSGSLVSFGRKLAIDFDCCPGKLDRAPKWQKELVSALDQAGFIRHDCLRTHRVWQLYEMLVPDLVADFFSEDVYENTPDVTDEEFASVLSMLDFLRDQEKVVVTERLGLSDGDPKTLRTLAKRYFVTDTRIGTIERIAFRKLRHPSQRCMLPPLFGFVPPKPVSSWERRVASSSGNENLTLDSSIDGMDLSVRAYNCLKRAGIHTVSDLTERTVEDLMGVRNLGRMCLREVLEKMRTAGFNTKES